MPKILLLICFGWVTMINTTDADDSVHFEVLLDGQRVWQGQGVADQADADVAWERWKSLDLAPAAGSSLPVSTDKPTLLRGQIEMRASSGERAVLTELPLIAVGPAWRIHPAAVMQTFRLKQPPVAAPESAAQESVSSATLPRGVARRIVIAHRGASGYLPEHTIPCASLAHGIGADFVEQDLVLTQDRVPIVLHDIHLDTVTDVAQQFPQRARADGRWYALDFTLAEIKGLRVHERTDPRTGQPVFANRFPLNQAKFEIATLVEMIELIQGLNRSTGRNTGIYPELKHPSWHREQGYDLARETLLVLNRYGYVARRDPIFVQCFEAAELKRLRTELRCRLPLIQLLDDDAEGDALWSANGMREVSTYADALGPSLARIFHIDDAGQIVVDPGVSRAHQAGLVVHPYTLRQDALPAGVDSFARLVEICDRADVDGFFSDFPDRSRFKAPGVTGVTGER